MDKIEKRCKKCNSVRYMDDFYKNKCTTDGYQSYCKQCQGATAKVTQQKNRIKHQKTRVYPATVGFYVLCTKGGAYCFIGKRIGNSVFDPSPRGSGKIFCRFDECEVLITIWESAK